MILIEDAKLQDGNPYLKFRQLAITKMKMPDLKDLHEESITNENRLAEAKICEIEANTENIRARTGLIRITTLTAKITLISYIIYMISRHGGHILALLGIFITKQRYSNQP